MKSKSGVQFILSFDGKLVAPGCKGDQKGDTDMWGIEGPPNLSTLIKILHETLALANAINVDVDNSTVKNHFHNLQCTCSMHLHFALNIYGGGLPGHFTCRKN